MSALYDKNTLLKMYHYCTDQPYGFLWINLRAKSPAEMFHFKFEKKTFTRLINNGCYTHEI
jgi:hypothetical protein